MGLMDRIVPPAVHKYLQKTLDTIISKEDFEQIRYECNDFNEIYLKNFNCGSFNKEIKKDGVQIGNMKLSEILENQD